MKKSFLLLVVFSLSLTGYIAQGQTCLITRDSVIAGQRASTFSDYIYGPNDRIDQVAHTDSGSLIVTTSDLVLYTGSDITEIKTFNTVGTSTLIRTIAYTYSGGKISRVDASGNNGNPWAMSHDITYNGSEIADIIIDGSSIVGNPEGLTGSFIDFVWSGGNITSLSILLGTDTIELAVVTDDKNSLYKDLLNTEGASFLFQAASQNNLVSATLVNDETAIGQTAGTKILDRAFTYNSENDVETLTENPTPLDPQSKTVQYIYDCSVGARAPQTATAISLYPNPAQNVISIENGNFKGVVKIFDITGKETFSQEILNGVSSLDISSLQPGMYYVEMVAEGKTFKGKIFKN